jgi:hypothetical protein
LLVDAEVAGEAAAAAAAGGKDSPQQQQQQQQQQLPVQYCVTGAMPDSVSRGADLAPLRSCQRCIAVASLLGSPSVLTLRQEQVPRLFLIKFRMLPCDPDGWKTWTYPSAEHPRPSGATGGGAPAARAASLDTLSSGSLDFALSRWHPQPVSAAALQLVYHEDMLLCGGTSRLGH